MSVNELAGPSIRDFLEARIAEDIAAGNAATNAPLPYDYRGKTAGPVWSATDYGMVIGEFELWDNEGSSTLSMNPAVAAHVAAHDPARVLDECRSKRALIPLIKEVEAYDPVLAVGMLETLACSYGTHPEFEAGAWLRS